MYIKLSKFLYKLSRILRQKSLYFELKSYIVDNQTHLKPVTIYDRGIGKTTTLIQLAHKYKAPIVTHNNAYARNIERLVASMGKNVDVFSVSNGDIRGRRFDLILCEDGISPETFAREIMPCAERVVGFK